MCVCLLFVCFLREDDRVGLEKGGLHVEDEWRNTVGTGISLLLGKERAIHFEVLSWSKRGKYISN